MIRGYGIDLSHHQDPTKVPWSRVGAECNFCICRATYGAARDRAVVEHVRRARQDAVVAVGLYHFFRPSIPIDDQFAAFDEAAQAVRLGDGDIIPTIDVELDPIPHRQPVEAGWGGAVKELRDRLADKWGGVMIYITAYEWALLGKPRWISEGPLWVAHYTTSAAPATPAHAIPVIWQHRVGPFDPKGAGGYDAQHPLYDQNRQLLPLPSIGTPANAISQDEADRLRGLIALTMLESERGAPEPPDRMRYA